MSRSGLRLVTAIAAALAGVVVSTSGRAEGQVTPPAKPAAPRPAPGAQAAKAPPAAKTAEPAVAPGTEAVVETAKGSFTIRLLPQVAPEHAKHFVKTAKTGGYDGTTFHRIITGGMIQGGDPLTKDPAKAAQYGTGGLGLLKAEFSDRPFVRGTVGAARRSNKDSGGSQFFVAVKEQPQLLGQYTIFGEVVSGMEVVDQISMTPVDDDKPRERVEMKVTIRPPAPVAPVAP
jgi:cyclophilin family peptidyl-prolyl cis-trans isomerase